MRRDESNEGGSAQRAGVSQEAKRPTNAPTPPEGHREQMTEVPLGRTRSAARIIPVLAALLAGIAIVYLLGAV